MRRVMGAAIALLLLPASPAAAADHTITAGDDFFNPSTVQIAVGDTVHWTIASGSVGNHNVNTPSTEKDESFDSDPGESELTISHPAGQEFFSHTFNKDGVEVDFICRVHPLTMTGKVVVGSPAADTASPKLSGAKVKVKKKALNVSFSLDEDARVALRVASAKKPKKTLRSVTKSLAAGKRSISVRRGALPPAGYKVTLTAEDDAGNESRAARTSFRIKPPKR